MTYTLALPDADARDLAVTALRSEADRRSRASEQLAGIVRQDKAAGQDVRPSAVRVTMLLGEAAELRAMADMLAEAPETGVIAGPVVNGTPARTLDEALAMPTAVPADEPLPGVDVGTGGDDGTSEAAQRLAELAGLTADDPDARAYDPNEPEDPETGATSEDEPTDAEIEEVP